MMRLTLKMGYFMQFEWLWSCRVSTWCYAPIAMS